MKWYTVGHSMQWVIIIGLFCAYYDHGPENMNMLSFS